MSVNVLIDMNLSPDWVPVLQRHGWPAVHWSTVGDPRASDRTIMDWAVANGSIVFTHDLDFGTMLTRMPLVRACFRCVPKMYCPTIWKAS